MTNVLVTGSRGFIGKNLMEALSRTKDVAFTTFDRGDTDAHLEQVLGAADVVYHLAGVNRPKEDQEFADVNAGLTRTVTTVLERLGRAPLVVLASSTQAELDNPYGKSKKAAEEVLTDFGRRTGARIAIYRLPGVFGKWSRPNYNTVVATFCHNIARGLDIAISDRSREITLVYIDDVVQEFLGLLERKLSGGPFLSISRSFTVTLGELADRIRALRDMRKTLVVPDLDDKLMRCLHATFLSFCDERDLSYPLDVKKDERGSLFELIKSPHFGQIFLSRTRAGVIRGNHYHNSKVEKFCVIQGRAVIRFRHILSREVISYHVSDEKVEVVDIPPGYTHSIENLSAGEMVVLFWANEVFDAARPDTYFLPVEPDERAG